MITLLIAAVAVGIWQRESLMNILPKLPSIIGMWAGGLAGYVTHPMLWFGIGSPFRWLHYLTVTASQESGYNAGAVGDVETGIPSYGLLQFRASTWEPLTGRPATDATKCWLAGYYAAAYVQDALLTYVKWWLVRVPVYGMGVMRRMWRSGISQSSADGATSWADTGAESYAGSRVWPSYLAWLPFFFLLSASFSYVLYDYRIKRGKVIR